MNVPIYLILMHACMYVLEWRPDTALLWLGDDKLWR